MENNCFWSVVLHDRGDDWLKDRLIGDVVNAVAEWKIDSVILALPHTGVAKFAGTWEVLAVLVERACHDTIRSVESLLNTVAMMDIDIDVQDSGLEAKQLYYTKDNVVDVTEATSFALLGVMKTTSPVHSNVAFAAVETCCAFRASSSGDTTELEKAIENWAIVSDVEFTLLFQEGVHVVWRQFL